MSPAQMHYNSETKLKVRPKKKNNTPGPVRYHNERGVALRQHKGLKATPLSMSSTVVRQACQPSRFYHESHDFSASLRVSRPHKLISQIVYFAM